jgi:hypothetical protein
VTIIKPGVLGDGVKVGVSIERRAAKTQSARVTPRRNGVPVGPDYRMFMSGRFDANDGAIHHVPLPPVQAPS